MEVILSVGTGIALIVISLFLIRKEFIRATRFRNSNFSGLSDSNVKEVIEYLDKIEVTIEEMNQSFYEIANDLEEKFSMHNKEIDIIDQKVNDINLLISGLVDRVDLQEKKTIAKKGPKKVSNDLSQAKSLGHNNEEKTIVEPLKASSIPIDQPKEDTGKQEITMKSDEQGNGNKLKNDILRLKASGMDINQIARTLNKSVREIQIMLSFLE